MPPASRAFQDLADEGAIARREMDGVITQVKCSMT